MGTAGETSTHESDRRWAGSAAVTVAAVGFGLSPAFATAAFDEGVSPIAASFIRIAAVMLMLLPAAPGLRGWRRESIVVASGGAISMIGFAGFFTALDRAPVAAATVVYYTYPVVVLLLSAAIWHRRLRAWEVSVCVGVLVGVILAVGPIGMSSALVVALAPAIAAPLGWAIYLLILSGPAAAMPTLPKVFAGSIGGVIALGPIALWQTGGRLMPLTAGAVVSMGLLTVCTLAIPAVLVTWGAARSGDRATAMVGSVEFVIAVAAGWLLLGDTVTSIQLAGIGLVLMSAAVAALHSTSGSDRSPHGGQRSDIVTGVAASDVRRQRA